MLSLNLSLDFDFIDFSSFDINNTVVFLFDYTPLQKQQLRKNNSEFFTHFGANDHIN